MGIKISSHVRAAIVCGALCFAAPALAFDEDTVVVKVGYGAGGSYDLAARLVANHIGRFLPGEPDIVVQNVPGAASLRLTQLMLGGEPNDGSVIGVVNPSMAYISQLEPETVSFDALELGWVGALSSVESMCVVARNTDVDTIQELAGQDLLFGATGRGGTTYMFAAMARNSLDAQFGIVTGFENIPEIELAMQRGEIAGHCVASHNDLQRADFREAVNVLVRFGAADVGEYGTLPRLYELVDDPERAEAVEFLESIRDHDYPVIMPAGTSEETLSIFREAFDAMVVDPDFLAEADELGEFTIQPTSGAELQAILVEKLSSSPEFFALARSLLQ